VASILLKKLLKKTATIPLDLIFAAEYSTRVQSLQDAVQLAYIGNHLQSAQPIKKLRHRPGTATYSKGQATAASILETARQVVLDYGMRELSMRRIAREMGLSPGNLSYYYASKADLLEDLFTLVIDGYMSEFERLREVEADSAEAQLTAVLEFVFDDLGQRETTNFFPELWVLALRDEWAAVQMERIYGLYRSVIVDILQVLRSDLDEQVISDLAITISASIEGHTVFIGHGRQHAARAPQIKKLIIGQLINLALTTGQEPIAAN
jgi:AcrR family transcriptional regulator